LGGAARFTPGQVFSAFDIHNLAILIWFSPEYKSYLPGGIQAVIEV
jgi:NAD(P)H-dependent FMN reductase